VNSCIVWNGKRYLVSVIKDWVGLFVVGR